MGIASLIILGLIAGLIAKALKPGPDPGGWIVTILIGIAGAFLGGWIGSWFGLGSIDGFNFRTILLATGGSLIILLLYALIRKK